MNAHPSQETLLRAALDDLAEGEAFELREHLIQCADCAARFRTVMDEPDAPPTPDLEVKTEQRDAAWQRLQASLAAENLVPDDQVNADDQIPDDDQVFKADSEVTEGSDSGLVLPMPARPRRRFGASELIKVAALLGLGLGLGSQMAPRIPSQGPVITSLIERSSVRSADGKVGDAIHCSPSEELMVWRFIMTDPELKDQTVRIEVTQPDGTVTSSEGNLRNGELSIYRWRSQTASGSYNFRFLTTADEPGEIENFSHEVVCD